MSGRNQLTTSAVLARLPMPMNANIKPEQWRVLTDAIFPNAKTPEAVMMALAYCKSRNLDPFKRPVHIVPMWSTASKKMIETVWPGINELQVTAARSGAWAGMDEPQWGPEREYTFAGPGDQDQDGSPIPSTNITVRAHEWCSVTVYRVVNGEKVAFSEPVYWTEAYARAGRNTEMPNDMWRKRPKGQHIKCAKAASLRAAFPEDLGSTYAAEEMEDKEITATGPVIEARAESHIHQEDEQEWSEFLVRAERDLLAEPNGTKWLRLLGRLTETCPDVSDLKILRSLDSVHVAHDRAPAMIKEQIAALFATAQKRLADASVAETKAEDDTSPGDKTGTDGVP